MWWTSVLFGHGTLTTTGRGWQGLLSDSEEDTWELLQDLELLEEEEEEEERLRRKRETQPRAGAIRLDWTGLVVVLGPQWGPQTTPGQV